MSTSVRMKKNDIPNFARFAGDRCWRDARESWLVSLQGILLVNWPEFCVGETGIVYRVEELITELEAVFYHGTCQFGYKFAHIFCVNNFRGEIIEKKVRGPDGKKEKTVFHIPPHLYPCDGNGGVFSEEEKLSKWTWMVAIDSRKQPNAG